LGRVGVQVTRRRTRDSAIDGRRHLGTTLSTERLPTRMLWLPNDETQLQDALDQGLRKEQHTLDFKSALPPSKGMNKELAKDLIAGPAQRGGRPRPPHRGR
jgi:hypothetical protein